MRGTAIALVGCAIYEMWMLLTAVESKEYEWRSWMRFHGAWAVGLAIGAIIVAALA